MEHDPMLYEDAEEMVEYVSPALKQISREATILLYSPALDPHLKKMTELADWVFCSEQARGRAKSRSEDVWGTDHLGSVLMKWPWRREARLIESRPMVSLKVLELQDGQGDPSRGLPSPACRRGGDDNEEAGGKVKLASGGAEARRGFE